jgi:hypothetical protein
VIGQNASDNSRYLEAVALFQLLTPSACNNTYTNKKVQKKYCMLWLPSPGAVHCSLKSAQKFHILKRKQNGFEPVRNVNDQEIPKLLTEKDSENTKRSTKVCTTLFEEYLKQKQRNYLVIKYLPTGVGS